MKRDRMTAIARLLPLLAAIASAPATVGAAQPQSEQEAALIEDSVRARDLAMAVHIYHHERAALPPDLAALAPYLGATDDQVASRLVSVLADPPERAGDFAAWLNEHASFRYLGSADVSLDDVTDWDRTVIGHLRLDLAHHGPAGAGVPVAFLDGHAEVLPPQVAAELIEESSQLFAALATGGPLPDYRQAQWNLRRIAQGLTAYAAAHEGLLPADLAEIFDYIPAGKGLTTPQQKARIFLAPKAARNTAIPEAPTLDWIRQHCAWEYLAPAPGGAAAVPLALIEDPGATVLVHARPADTVERPGDDRRLLPLATASGAVDTVSRDLAAWRIDQSRKVIDFARSRGEAPLPDLQHAMRDLRLLSAALRQYAQLADGAMPARLSDLYDLVEDPQLDLTAAQRAQLFLTPTAQRLLPAPPAPADGARDWLAERANYVLVAPGAPGLRSNIAPVLLHHPLDEPLTTRTEGGELHVIIVVDAAGNILTMPRDAAEQWIRGER